MEVPPSFIEGADHLTPESVADLKLQVRRCVGETFPGFTRFEIVSTLAYSWLPVTNPGRVLESYNLEGAMALAREDPPPRATIDLP